MRITGVSMTRKYVRVTCDFPVRHVKVVQPHTNGGILFDDLQTSQPDVIPPRATIGGSFSQALVKLSWEKEQGRCENQNRYQRSPADANPKQVHQHGCGERDERASRHCQEYG